MSDSTSMFILYVLELLRWNGDTETLRLAALWQMNVSSEFGVPLKLETTYDILQFPQDYELSTYATVVRTPKVPSIAVLSAQGHWLRRRSRRPAPRARRLDASLSCGSRSGS
eukprot:SAG22_NODE_435_length_10524_cov_8.503789_8_plen_112_part_00